MAIAGKVAIVPKGKWNSEEAYENLDLVTHNNALYIAKQGSTNIAPQDGEYWMFCVQSADETTIQDIINGDMTVGEAEKAGKDADGNVIADTYLTKTGDSKDNTVTFSQADTRSNIATGEKQSILFGKIAKFFADLKTVAFTGSYTDLSNKPSIPTAVAVKGNAESSYRTGNVNLTCANIGALSATGNAASATKATKDGNGNVIADTYVKKTAVLTTMEEIKKNTSADNAAGALTVKELRNNALRYEETVTGSLSNGIFTWLDYVWTLSGNIVTLTIRGLNNGNGYINQIETHIPFDVTQIVGQTYKTPVYGIDDRIFATVDINEYDDVAILTFSNSIVNDSKIMYMQFVMAREQ